MSLNLMQSSRTTLKFSAKSGTRLDLPLPACVCRNDDTLKVLSISRDLENEVAGFSSLKDFLPEAVCQKKAAEGEG